MQSTCLRPTARRIHRLNSTAFPRGHVHGHHVQLRHEQPECHWPSVHAWRPRMPQARPDVHPPRMHPCAWRPSAAGACPASSRIAGRARRRRERRASISAGAWSSGGRSRVVCTSRWRDGLQRPRAQAVPLACFLDELQVVCAGTGARRREYARIRHTVADGS